MSMIWFADNKASEFNKLLIPLKPLGTVKFIAETSPFIIPQIGKSTGHEDWIWENMTN